VRTLSDEQAWAKWQEIGAMAERLSNRAGSEGGFTVSPGSPLAGDDAHCQPYHVSHAVTTNIISAIDHLHAMCALILRSGVLHAAAPATLARAILECASTAIWIAVPGRRDERVRRALRWNVQDIKDGDRAAAEAGLEVPTPLQDRMDKIEAVAMRRSLEFKPISGGYKSTEAVKAAEEYLASPLRVCFPWQLASGFAHGRRWAMLAFADLLPTLPTADPDVVKLRWENDNTIVLYLGMAAAIAVKGAIRLYDERSKSP